MEHLKTSIFVLVALLAAGCGSYPAPTAKMSSAEAAMRSATEVGAAKVPQAQLHVKLAEEQLAKAKQLMQSGDNERAESLLVRAQADAELALSLAKQANAQTDAQRALDEVKTAKDKLK
jgi:hypothetical protein